MTAEPHPQRCETCEYHDATRFDGIIYFGECTKIGVHPLPLISREIYTFQGGLCCHGSAQSEQEIREKVLDEFKWIRPMCFGRHEAICDTRCAWAVRKRCVAVLRSKQGGEK